MKVRLTDVAKVIRSKNAGPFELTLDIIFREQTVYDLVRERTPFTREIVAALYRIPVEEILSVIHFDPAKAVKITMLRRLPSGAPGETVVYGAQQHAPLLDFVFELEEKPS